MQAPAARFLRTPVRSRRRRCKHLRRRLRSVIAPSSKAHSKGPGPGLATGLSTNFDRSRVNPSVLSTVRPRTRWRKGWSCGPGDSDGASAWCSPARSGSSDDGLRVCRQRPGRSEGRQAARPRPGRRQGNARRNRRTLAESPRASSSGLKASAHRPLRARITMPGVARPWLPAYPRPSSLQGRFPGGFPPPIHRSVERHRAAEPGHNETPEGTNRFAGPFPPMQAPAARFLRTPVRSLRRRCKHLRRRLRSVMAPSGKTNTTGAGPRLAMGLSTNFEARVRIPCALSTVRPRTRWRKGWCRGIGARNGPRLAYCSSGQRSPPGRSTSPSASSRTVRSSGDGASRDLDQVPGPLVDPADVPGPRPRLEPRVDADRRHPRSRSDRHGLRETPSAIAAAAGEPRTNSESAVLQGKVRWRIPSGVTTLPWSVEPAASGWRVSRPAGDEISRRSTRPERSVSNRIARSWTPSLATDSRQRRPRRPSATDQTTTSPDGSPTRPPSRSRRSSVTLSCGRRPALRPR